MSNWGSGGKGSYGGPDRSGSSNSNKGGSGSGRNYGGYSGLGIGNPGSYTGTNNPGRTSVGGYSLGGMSGQSQWGGADANYAAAGLSNAPTVSPMDQALKSLPFGMGSFLKSIIKPPKVSPMQGALLTAVSAVPVIGRPTAWALRQGMTNPAWNNPVAQAKSRALAATAMPEVGTPTNGSLGGSGGLQIPLPKKKTVSKPATSLDQSMLAALTGETTDGLF